MAGDLPDGSIHVFGGSDLHLVKKLYGHTDDVVYSTMYRGVLCTADVWGKIIGWNTEGEKAFSLKIFDFVYRVLRSVHSLQAVVVWNGNLCLAWGAEVIEWNPPIRPPTVLLRETHFTEVSSMATINHKGHSLLMTSGGDVFRRAGGQIRLWKKEGNFAYEKGRLDTDFSLRDLRVFDENTLFCIPETFGGEQVFKISLSSRNDGGGRISLNIQRLNVHPGPSDHFFSSMCLWDNLVVCFSERGRELHVYDARSGDRVHTLNAGAEFEFVDAMTPHGNRLYVGGTNVVAIWQKSR